MRTRCDGRFRPAYRRARSRDDSCPVGCQIECVGRDIGVDEVDPRADQSRWTNGSIRVADNDGRNADAVAAQDPGLGRHVVKLVGLDPSGIFDLD